MKTRNGFVSNSSSSSFMVITDIHEITMEELSTHYKYGEQREFMYDIINRNMKLIDKEDKVAVEDIRSFINRIASMYLYYYFSDYGKYESDNIKRRLKKIFVPRILTESKFNNLFEKYIKMYSKVKDTNNMYIKKDDKKEEKQRIKKLQEDYQKQHEICIKFCEEITKYILDNYNDEWYSIFSLADDEGGVEADLEYLTRSIELGTHTLCSIDH